MFTLEEIDGRLARDQVRSGGAIVEVMDVVRESVLADTDLGPRADTIVLPELRLSIDSR